MLLETLAELRKSWEDVNHADTCDTSCPDCLRSYNNSQKHSLLDWRLALDFLELCTGSSLNVQRSMPAEAAWMESSATALPNTAIDVIEGVPVLHRDGKCVVLTHPLWRKDSKYYWGSQRSALDEAGRRFSSVASHDLRDYKRNPISALRFLL